MSKISLSDALSSSVTWEIIYVCIRIALPPLPPAEVLSLSFVP